jgi:hypothetical protein
MVDARDAEKVVIPMVILASKNEPKKDVSKYHGALKAPKHVEAFENQVYGFMSARGDLNDNNSKRIVLLLSWSTYSLSIPC